MATASALTLQRMVGANSKDSCINKWTEDKAKTDHPGDYVKEQATILIFRVPSELFLLTDATREE
ncbi:MAG: hypothetical protein ABI675_25460 [Chitinophagaceae bacterium]